MLHNFNPIAFTLGNYAITWYWLFYPLGFLIVFLSTYQYLKKSKEDFHLANLIDFFILFWVGILLGGRFGYFLFYQPELLIKEPLLIFAFHLGGMSVHGAFLGGLIMFLVYSWWKKKSPLLFIDAMVLFSPLALMLGRIGNFINGELWGRPSDLPWAMVFPSADALTRHPSQLYQALMEGPILFGLLWIFKDIKIRAHNTLLFFLFYFILRFISEFFREPDAHIGYVINYFTYGQVLSIIGFVVVFLLFIKVSQTSEKN